MKSLIKITILAISAMLVTVGSLMAQDKTESCKSEKKSDSACCSSKGTNSKMDHKKMSNLKSIDKNQDGKVFQCPMKCEAPQDENGECSKCGMDLKKTSVSNVHAEMMKSMKKTKQAMDLSKVDKNKDGKVYECPMKCETAIDKPGQCSKCGMDLKKASVK